MTARKLGASIAALALVSTMAIGCAGKKEVEQANAAATRAEDAARRADAATGRCEAAASRCESAGTPHLRK
jgi:hypothetical protein